MSGTRPSAIDLPAPESRRRSKSPLIAGVCIVIIASALGWLVLSVTEILKEKRIARIHGFARDTQATPRAPPLVETIFLCRAAVDDPAQPGTPVDILSVANEYRKDLDNIAQLGTKRSPRAEASAAVDTLMNGSDKFTALKGRFARCLRHGLLAVVRSKPDGSYEFPNVPPGEYVIGMADDLAGARRVTVEHADISANIDY